MFGHDFFSSFFACTAQHTSFMFNISCWKDSGDSKVYDTLVGFQFSYYFPVGTASIPDISSFPEDSVRGMISHSLSTVGVVTAWHHDQGNKVTPKPRPNHSLTLTIYNLCGKVAFVRPFKDTSSVMGHINQLQLRETSQTTSAALHKDWTLCECFRVASVAALSSFPP